LKAWNPTRSTLEQQPLSSQFAAMASLHTLPKVFPSGMKTAPGDLISRGPFHLVAGTGFEPATSGL
jgi:hypothetical protein